MLPAEGARKLQRRLEIGQLDDLFHIAREVQARRLAREANLGGPRPRMPGMRNERLGALLIQADVVVGNLVGHSGQIQIRIQRVLRSFDAELDPLRRSQRPCKGGPQYGFTGVAYLELLEYGLDGEIGIALGDAGIAVEARSREDGG